MSTENSKLTDGLIVLLGSPNTETGELYSVAKERCELALIEYHHHPNWKRLQPDPWTTPLSNSPH